MPTKRKGSKGADDRGRKMSREEALLWRHVADDVSALPGRGVSVPEETQTDETVPPAPPPSRVRRPAAPPREPEPEYPHLEPGTVAGIDKRTAGRLRRGQIAIEGRLDLHGHTQDEAFEALASFLAASQAADKRCVIVITGKGRGGEGTGVLRDRVPKWLNAHPNRGRVLAFAHAQPRHGGDGALYVMLRKKK